MTGMLSRLHLKKVTQKKLALKGTKKYLGFTLIELLIAVAVVAVLAAIALPTYTSQMQKVRRTDAKTGLMDLQARMEHFFTENNTYVGATTPAAVGGSATSAEGYYTLSISNVTATTYTLTAAPAAGSPQEDDTICGTYTLTNTNVKTPNPADCW